MSNEVGGTAELFAESVTTLAGIIEDEGPNPALVAYLLDTINEIQSADFWVPLHLRVVGVVQPRKKEIKQPIEAWLATLDREAELAKRVHQRQSERIAFRDWEIELEPIPKGTPGTKSNSPLIGIRPSSAGFVGSSKAPSGARVDSVRSRSAKAISMSLANA